MAGRFLFAAIEAWAVARLLRSPAFHRGVQAIHKRINRIRHGPSLEDMGGTKIDNPRAPSEFFKHFGDEVKTQLGIKKPPHQK